LRTITPVWTRDTVYKEYPSKSPAEAKLLLKKIVEERLRRRYIMLPKGIRITPREMAAGITRRRRRSTR
jgi:hypothetical protein